MLLQRGSLASALSFLSASFLLGLGFVKYQEEARQKCVLGPGCHPPVVRAFVCKSPPHLSTGLLGMAQETAFSKKKVSISTLGLVKSPVKHN